MTTVECINGALVFNFKCETIKEQSRLYPPFRVYPGQDSGYFVHGLDNKIVYLGPGSYIVEGVEKTLEELVESIENGSLCHVPTNTGESSSIAAAQVSGDANADNVLLTLSEDRADTNLVISSNSITNNIGGNFVLITAFEYFTATPSGSLSNIAPQMELIKNGNVICISATGYQRHQDDHSSSSNSLTYIDYAPQVGDVYSLRASRGSTETEVMPIDCGHFQLMVVEKN